MAYTSSLPIAAGLGRLSSRSPSPVTCQVEAKVAALLLRFREGEGDQSASVAGAEHAG
jgi:hypothetical protein